MTPSQKKVTLVISIENSEHFRDCFIRVVYCFNVLMTALLEYLNFLNVQFADPGVRAL